MQNEFNIDNVNAWLKEHYGMSYDEVLKQYNQAVDMFLEQCQKIVELRKEINELVDKK